MKVNKKHTSNNLCDIKSELICSIFFTYFKLLLLVIKFKKLTVNKAKCNRTCDASDNRYQYAILKNKTSN